MKTNLQYNDSIVSLLEQRNEVSNLALRKKAINSLKSIGLPGHKHEEWKYTNPDNLIKNDYFSTLNNDLLVVDLKSIKNLYSSNIANTIVFHDGVFSPSDSKIEEANFEIDWNEEEPVDADFGSYMNIENESFLALNAALHFQNLRLSFESNKKYKLEIIHIISRRSRLSNPRINIRLQPFAEVEIVEKVIDLGSAENNTLYNISTNAIVEHDAKLEIHKIQSQLKSSSKIVDSLKVLLKKSSSAYVNTFSITAGITRNNIYAVLSGEEGYFDVKGLSLLDDAEHVDNRTIIEHDSPNCNSNQLYKGIFNGSSTGVFNGKIVVKQDAQKTNAFQSNKNLLMSKDASIYSKPQLEIFADDVKCSHGATSSQPDEDALFYLESRGISPATAKAMLTYAFANEITDNLTNEEVKTFISQQIAQKLGLDWI